MNLNEFLISTYPNADYCVDNDFIGLIRPRVECADKLSMSIQASRWHYSTPQMNVPSGEYENLEIGFPSEDIPEFDDYAENHSISHSMNVFPYVPYDIVEHVIEKHGGITRILEEDVDYGTERNI